MVRRHTYFHRCLGRIQPVVGGRDNADQLAVVWQCPCGGLSWTRKGKIELRSYKPRCQGPNIWPTRRHRCLGSSVLRGRWEKQPLSAGPFVSVLALLVHISKSARGWAQQPCLPNGGPTGPKEETRVQAMVFGCSEHSTRQMRS